MCACVCHLGIFLRIIETTFLTYMSVLKELAEFVKELYNLMENLHITKNNVNQFFFSWLNISYSKIFILLLVFFGSTVLYRISLHSCKYAIAWKYLVTEKSLYFDSPEYYSAVWDRQCLADGNCSCVALIVYTLQPSSGFAPCSRPFLHVKMVLNPWD